MRGLEYIPPTIAEELQKDLAEYAEYADMSEELGLFKRLAFHPEMEGIYRKLARRFSSPLDWSLFYSHLVADALASELFKGIKQSRAEFKRRKQQARRGLRDLIEGLDWITDAQELHGFSIDFREDLQARLYGVFAASVAGESVPARKDIDPREFLSTCRTVLDILDDTTRQRDSFREQTSGTAPPCGICPLHRASPSGDGRPHPRKPPPAICRIPDDCTVFGGIAEDVKHTSLSWPA